MVRSVRPSVVFREVDNKRVTLEICTLDSWTQNMATSDATLVSARA
jgi:hypothetical protein